MDSTSNPDTGSASRSDSEPPPYLPVTFTRLQALARRFPSLQVENCGWWEEAGRQWGILRLRFSGPKAAFTPFKVAVFAGIHGDEPGGTEAVLHLLDRLQANPAVAAGYELFFYPCCNPVGMYRGTRGNGGGIDLNRAFWCEHEAVEVRLMEQELRSISFDGIISLHADNDSDGLYGFTLGQLLNQMLLEPALRAAQSQLPLNAAGEIDGFNAKGGMIETCYQGVLSPLPGANPRPFEIIFETPGRAPLEAQAFAGALAIEAILEQYRSFMAYSINL